jgi:predicted RNA-binding protein (virulence factor B family)
VLRRTRQGLYLGSEDDEVLLPGKYAPDDAHPGSRLRVFVHTDSEDRRVATTRKPKAVVGEFARLRVAQVGTMGAFLDWGLEKDLLAPFREQALRMAAGRTYLVRVCHDEKTGRLFASSRIQKFLSPPRGLKSGKPVEMLVYELTPLGYNVILDHAFGGLLYHDQTPERLKVGDVRDGWVQRVRPDGGVDVTLRPTTKEAAAEGKPLILERLEAAGVFLPFHDGSAPAEIERVFGMSKKAFKRAMGNLFQERRILIEGDGIRLVPAKKPPRRS